MYIPPHFEEHRPEAIRALIAAYPLGTLVTGSAATGLDAVHVPFHVDGDLAPNGVLQAHVARANDVVRADGEAVLVVFHGPQAYVSPNWYPSKAETHRHVPTWNYQAVHVHGTLRLRDDARFLRGLLARLTRTQEARVGEAAPWRMGDAPADYIEGLLRVIVGIEVTVQRVVAVSKLSQNRALRDHANVAETLRAQGRGDVADAMEDAPGRPR